ncbi:MAG TPA: glycosyltransferase [Dehalococcoidia bacterium]|nr:glycosyltransferase [Dehalococcoidia bacterium]
MFQIQRVEAQQEERSAVTSEGQNDRRITASIGICAYNEEQNIGHLLMSIQNQVLHKLEIVQIVVVSSACCDGTEDIVRHFQDGDQRIHLITEAKRRGKAAAVNLFLRASRGDICILVSADTRLTETSCESLSSVFFDPIVGMAGGRPIPVNDQTTLMGFVSRLIWDMNHELSLIEPRLGEYIAFRNIVDFIPEDTAVDEAAIEAAIRKKGYSLRYVPEAIVYNKGPETVADFVKQRRRIYVGHLHLMKTSNYRVASLNCLRLLKLIPRCTSLSFKSIAWTFVSIILEIYARAAGSFDFFIRRKNPFIWEMISSTKSTKGRD